MIKWNNAKTQLPNEEDHVILMIPRPDTETKHLICGLVKRYYKGLGIEDQGVFGGVVYIGHYHRWAYSSDFNLPKE